MCLTAKNGGWIRRGIGYHYTSLKQRTQPPGTFFRVISAAGERSGSAKFYPIPSFRTNHTQQRPCGMPGTDPSPGRRFRRFHGLGHIFAVVNQKGGVGKTTTAVNVAASMAILGAKTLLIDFDPQANATSGLKIEVQDEAGSSYEVLMNPHSAADAIVRTSIPNLFLLPSTRNLAGAELELIDCEDRERFLKRAIEPLKKQYDWIFIDVPPSLGLLTINALVAADSALIPVQCEYYALEGVGQLIKTFGLVQRHLNPDLETGLVVLTMYDNRVRLAQQVVAEVRQVFGEKVSP